MKSEKIKIKLGIKQGCALSMILYILAIEELILRIKANSEIKGYVKMNFETKISAYADDIVGYVVDRSSIKEFFAEFEGWG